VLCTEPVEYPSSCVYPEMIVDRDWKKMENATYRPFATVPYGQFVFERFPLAVKSRLRVLAVWFGLVWFILVGTFSSMYYFIRDFYTLTVHAFLLFILVRCVFLLLCIRL